METPVQSCTIPQSFLRGRISLVAFFISEAKQTVCRCDYVLYFGTGLRFKKRDRVDQDGLVRDQLAGDLQFGNSCPRANTGPQNGF